MQFPVDPNNPPEGFYLNYKHEYCVFWFRYSEMYDGKEPKFDRHDIWEGRSFDTDKHVDEKFLWSEFFVQQEMRGVRVIVSWICFKQVDGKWVEHLRRES
jgi:hypothetical protein